MASGFQTPITIKDAMEGIHTRKYLLPSIQREFTWQSEQIEMLFDSIMRGYPINSFMFWKVTDEEIKSGYKFYDFLSDYREFFKTSNSEIATSGMPDFEAVIDGQQRLNSLYIGLYGSYAYKLPRKWWIDNDDNLPTRHLFLNLLESSNKEYDNQKQYDFRFLTDKEVRHLSSNAHLFRVGDIIQLKTEKDVRDYLKQHQLNENDFAEETLYKLRRVVHDEKLINFYLREEQNQDTVLDIFIRTNSGGTPLSFSDLLMSIASANWKKINAREALKDLVAEVNQIGRPGFIINKDFILKTLLVLFSDDIRFQLKNFDATSVIKFEDNWEKTRKCIIVAFTLFDMLGFNNTNFRAKNAAIPIILYIFKNNLEERITKETYDENDRLIIQKWLSITFMRSIFGGQSDSVLKDMREVVLQSDSCLFPFSKIVEKFKENPSKNYSLEDDFIDGLLKAQCGTDDADYVLFLLYSDFHFYNQEIHRDHMHAATIFRNSEKIKSLIPESDWEFAQDKENWNSVLNLQLLNGELNESKQAKTLKDWATEKNRTFDDLLVEDGVSLDIADFRMFIESRRKKIKEKLKTILN